MKEEQGKVDLMQKVRLALTGEPAPGGLAFAPVPCY